MCSIAGLTPNVRSAILRAMARTRVRRLVALVVAAVVLALVMGFVAGRAIAGPSSHARPRVYVVRQGDTRWGIAVRVAGPQADPRPVVDLLIHANPMTGERIMPGDRLTLPDVDP